MASWGNLSAVSKSIKTKKAIPSKYRLPSFSSVSPSVENVSISFYDVRFEFGTLAHRVATSIRRQQRRLRQHAAFSKLWGRKKKKKIEGRGYFHTWGLVMNVCADWCSDLRGDVLNRRSYIPSQFHTQNHKQRKLWKSKPWHSPLLRWSRGRVVFCHD